MSDLSEYMISAEDTSGSRTLRSSAWKSAKQTDWLVHLLNAYYDAEERNNLSGFPRINVLSKHWQHGSSGHRILIRGMRSRDMRTGMAIRSLTEAHQAVVFARYGIHRDAKGRPITNQQRAEYLSIPLRTFEARVKSACRILRTKLRAGEIPESGF